ncbi:MAG: flippase [bacterium]
MSQLERAARSSGWVFASKGAERLLRIGVVIVLARLLEARGFGVYSFAFAFAEMFAVFTDAGLHPILVREIAKDRAAAPRLMGSALVLKAILTAVSWLAALVVATWTIPAGEARWTALVASFSLFLSFRVASFRTVFDAPFEAGLEMGTPALYGTASEVFSAACLLAAVWMRWPLPALIGVQVAAHLPGAILLARTSRRRLRPVYGFAPALWRRLLVMALPVGAANLFLMAYTRSDILMLGWMRGEVSVGLYSAAYKLTGSLGIVPLALTTSLLPVLAAAFGEGDRERVGRIYRGVLSAAIAAGLPIAVAGSLLSTEIVALVYGPAYAPAARALWILAWAVAFNFVLYILTTSAMAVGRERLFMVYAGALSLLNVILNALLIPRFGFLGACWATVIAEGVMMAAGLAVLRPNVGLPAGGAALRALLSAAAAGAVLGWLPAPLAVRLIGSAILYTVLVYWGRGLSPEGLAALRLIVRQRLRPEAGEGS